MTDKRLYLEEKKEGSCTKVLKNLYIKPNNQSADFIAPPFAVGCELACSYCYVARNRQFGNPVTISDNTNEIIEAIIEHYYQQPPKVPNQQDPYQITYDIGESTDMLTSANIELTEYVIRTLVCRSDLKPTLATKIANKHTVGRLGKYGKLSRPYRARIRVSLMPQKLADIIELGTAPIIDRIKAIRMLYELDFEVHINFSPIVMYGESEWMKDYIDLCKLIDKELGNDFTAMKIKRQLKCEIIFLTHHERLHNHNLRWNKEAEKLLWTPDIQEYKTNNRGSSDILRYRMDLKKQGVAIMKGIIAKHLPYCEVRYAF